MRYGKTLETLLIPQTLINKTFNKLVNEKFQMTTGKTLSSTNKTKRNSDVTFIDEQIILKNF